jgi:hypothetical protein
VPLRREDRERWGNPLTIGAPSTGCLISNVRREPPTNPDCQSGLTAGAGSTPEYTRGNGCRSSTYGSEGLGPNPFDRAGQEKVCRIGTLLSSQVASQLRRHYGALMTLPTNVTVLLVDTADDHAVLSVQLPQIPRREDEVQVGEARYSVVDVVWHLPVSDIAPEVELKVKRLQAVEPWVMTEEDF